jgi:hypothetical protein
MNENQFQIDVEAEQQLLSTNLTTKPSDIAAQETETIATSFALPESFSLSEQLQPNVELAKSFSLSEQLQPNVELAKSFSLSEQLQPNVELAKSFSLSEQLQPNVELAQSILLEPTKLENTSAPMAEVSKVAAGLSVKFDAESSYNQLSKKVEDIEQGFDSNMNLSGDRWIPYPRAQNKFEEKPTTDPTNLIFENRMDRFSNFPIWQ